MSLISFLEASSTSIGGRRFNVILPDLLHTKCYNVQLFFLLCPSVAHQLWAGSNNIKNSLILVRILIESVLWQGSFRKTKVFMSHSTHQCIKRCALMITPSECHDSLALVGSNVSNR